MSDDPIFEVPQLALETVRPLSALQADRIDADYVVVHKQVAEETLFIMPGGPLGAADRAGGSAVPPHVARMHAATAGRALEICRQHPGLRAVYEDAWIVAFASEPRGASR